MTAQGREDSQALVVETTDKIERYDAIQKDIERYEAAQGTIHQVNLLHGQGFIAIIDSDMLSKAEVALTKLIAAKLDEQAAI